MYLFPRDTQVGIMIAFLLALVLEDVEKPYGGWRWVIAAQQMGRVQKTGWRAEFFESPAFFELGKNIPKNGSRFKNWVPDDGHFMSFSPDDDWWLSFSSPNFFAMCDNNQEKWREMAQVEVRWCRAWWVWTTSQIFNEFVALRLDYGLTGGWSGMDGLPASL